MHTLERGSVRLTFLGHSGFLIQDSSGKVIAIDPYSVSAHVPKADLILITHGHSDHCSIKDIELLARPGTTILVPADAQSKITRIDNVNMQIVELGDELTFGSVKIETVPAYNLNKDFHPKRERWFGYLIKCSGTTVYHAGDTDKIPEMDRLTGYGKHGSDFIALLPVSGTYVMDVDEALEVALLLKPTVAIPMHYGAVVGTVADAQKFVHLCREKGLEAEVLEEFT